MTDKIWTPGRQHTSHQPEGMSKQAKSDMLDMLLQESQLYRQMQAMLNMAAQEGEPVLMGSFQRDDGTKLGIFAVTQEIPDEEAANDTPSSH